MLFKIKEIGDDGLSLNLPMTAAWLAGECPDLDAVLGPRGLTVRGQLTVSENDVFLRGTLRGDLQATCSRCLEKAKLPVDVPLQVTFVARSEDADESEDDQEDEELDVASYDGDKIDLGPEIRDQLLLSLPITTLCREDCAGLCPLCGGNRNQVACDCEAEQDNPRTPLAAALGKLKI
jgi:uncharacterized protein